MYKPYASYQILHQTLQLDTATLAPLPSPPCQGPEQMLKYVKSTPDTLSWSLLFDHCKHYTENLIELLNHISISIYFLETPLSPKDTTDNWKQ